MATAARSFITGGAVLASAAAIAVVPTVHSASGLPAPTSLSTAQFELTSLADITIQGITDAVASGWGGNLGPADPFYPNAFANDVKVSGISGAIYYVLDESGLVPFNLEDYFFEAGPAAVAYVGISSVFGANSLPGQLAKAVFADGTMNIADAVVALTAGIPVIGALTSVYFTGQVPGDTTVYGTGFAGVLAYANTVVPGISDFLSNLGIGKGHGSDDDDESEDESDDAEDGNGHGHGHGKGAAATRLVSTPAPSAAVSEAAPVADVTVDTTVSESATDSAPTVTKPVRAAAANRATRTAAAKRDAAATPAAGESTAEKPAAAQSAKPARAVRAAH